MSESQNEPQNTYMETESMAKKQPQAVDEPQENNELPAQVDVSALQAEIEALKQSVQVNTDGWQRARAEFSNYKRRTNQELSDARERGAQDAFARILPILDDFERALQNIPADWQGHSWVNGATLILKNLNKVLEEYNISVIDPIGKAFDPNEHEAIGVDSSGEYESGIVATTLQKGYKSGERILRPALVRVAQ